MLAEGGGDDQQKRQTGNRKYHTRKRQIYIQA